VEVSARIIEHDGLKLIQSIVRDIHERKTAEVLIQHALEERELLLEEIKQRVRLHHDLCIAGLESLKQHGEAGLPAEMLESQIRRIKALGYIQDRIYNTKNVKQIDFAKIASGLVKHLVTLYAVDASRVRCALEIRDVFMDIPRTTSCAQILIEVVGNAFTHAFPGKIGGIVRIEMSRKEDDRYTLNVSDDGIGIAASLDIQKTPTLGMRLVKDLVGQLGGHMSLDNSKGTQIVIRFP
jgi:two-component sensor histidine kinase